MKHETPEESSQSLVGKCAERFIQLPLLDRAVILLLLGFTVVLCHRATDTVVAFGTLVAVAVGGWWTWTNHIRTRKAVPNGRLSVTVTEVQLTEQSNVIHAALHFENIGECLIEVGEFSAKFQSMRPTCSEHFNNRVAAWEKNPSAGDLVKRGETILPWPTIKQRSQQKRKKMQVEPGEIDQLFAEAVVWCDVEIVRVYGFVRDKRNKDIGWDCECIYRIQNVRPWKGEGNVELREGQEEERCEEEARGLDPADRRPEGDEEGGQEGCTEEGSQEGSAEEGGQEGSAEEGGQESGTEEGGQEGGVGARRAK